MTEERKEAIALLLDQAIIPTNGGKSLWCTSCESFTGTDHNAHARDCLWRSLRACLEEIERLEEKINLMEHGD